MTNGWQEPNCVNFCRIFPEVEVIDEAANAEEGITKN
jgi:hypothetical protein